MPTRAARINYLCDIFVRHQGNLSDKWEQYLSIYHAELSRFLNLGRPVDLLEIGVQNGGSLQIWGQYLPDDSSIVGIDIDDACRKLDLGPNIAVLVGDASDPAVLDRLIGGMQFDIIIDDGSHRSDHIIATFDLCFGRLKPGGLYIVEDLHSSYHDSYRGGFRKPGAAIEFFKSLADALNADHFEADAASSVEAPVLSHLKVLSSSIARLSFYDSVVVVEKLEEAKDGPYRRVLTGEVAPVFDQVKAISYAPREQLRRVYLSPTLSNASGPILLNEIGSAREELGVLRADRDRLLTELDTLRSAQDRKIGEQQAAVASAEETARNLTDRLSAVEAERAELRTLRPELETRLATETRLRQLDVKRYEILEQHSRQTTRQADELRANVVRLERDIGELHAEVARRRVLMDEILASTSWRISSPVRWVGRPLAPLTRKLRKIHALSRRAGGFPQLAGFAWAKFQRSGIAGLMNGLRDRPAEEVLRPEEVDPYEEIARLMFAEQQAELDRAAAITSISAFAHTPLVSVIMPVYNTPVKWLRRAVESLQDQVLRELGAVCCRRLFAG